MSVGTVVIGSRGGGRGLIWIGIAAVLLLLLAVALLGPTLGSELMLAKGESLGRGTIGLQNVSVSYRATFGGNGAYCNGDPALTFKGLNGSRTNFICLDPGQVVDSIDDAIRLIKEWIASGKPLGTVG